MRLDIITDSKRWFFFGRTEFEQVVEAVHDFWTRFEEQLGKLSTGSRKAKKPDGYRTFDERSKRIQADRWRLTQFLEEHMGGAAICYQMPRGEFMLKLVNFVKAELKKRSDARNSRKLQGRS